MGYANQYFEGAVVLVVALCLARRERFLGRSVKTLKHSFLYAKAMWFLKALGCTAGRLCERKTKPVRNAPVSQCQPQLHHGHQNHVLDFSAAAAQRWAQCGR